MKLYLAPNQWQMLVCIIRKTYGFHKKIDYITNTQICKETRVLKPNVSRALKVLEQRNIITRNGKHIGLQKDWEQWQKLSVQATKVISLDNPLNDKKLSIQQPKLSIQQPELSVQATKVISPLDTQKKDTIQKKLSKRKYGEFENILLTDGEYWKLKDQFGTETEARIEKISAYVASTGKPYKSHYAAILTWWRREKEGNDGNDGNDGKTKGRGLPKIYTPTTDYPDL